MKNIRNFKSFKESVLEREREKERERPDVKPDVKPGEQKPLTRPKRPSPIRRTTPSVKPIPKASEEDVIKKYMNIKK